MEETATDDGLTEVQKWERAVADMVICYVLVRTDVPNFMWGKTAAQTAHTGTQLVVDLYNKDFPDLNDLFEEWQCDPELELAAARAQETFLQHKGKFRDDGTPISPEGMKLFEAVMTAREAAEKAKRAFGTKLTLAVNAAEMRQTVNLAQLLGHHAGITHDPTYPIFIKDGDRTQVTTLPVDTCAYVFGRKSNLVPVLGQYDLLNEKHIVG